MVLTLYSRNKAVSDGAVSYYVSQMVTTRIARFSYGTFRNVQYNPEIQAHKDRRDDLLERTSGRRMVPNKWEVMLAKVSWYLQQVPPLRS
jgi:hypothetical protein